MARVPTTSSVGVVEGDDVGAAAGELEGVAAEAGAGVEHEVARAQAESVEADRQHQRQQPVGRSRRSLATLAGIASTSRYWSTVSSAQCRQVQRSTHAPATGGADAGAQRRRSSRPRRIAAASASTSPALALQHRLAVAAGDLGQGAAVGGDEADAGGHRLDRRQAEALVEAGHDGQLGLGVQLDDALVGDAR